MSTRVEPKEGQKTGAPQIQWKPSPGSTTCEKGWVGKRLLFSIIDEKFKLTLHHRLPGRDGLPMDSERFDVNDSTTTTQVRAKAHARATAIWLEFLRDVAMPQA
ncbi:hypothetical protein [Nonomuraea jabiensis]|uniref:Uncharacterized protein n=1 Tax=Nonomuraea jabiensis TaxID=882448 RepID=A0A7W9FZJ8_9ACTN|nr:hypothetical protein [Nonomuraea jabiensis]MBB5774421.1 hypothetical protein [Nonomuraea jabiensis]